MILWFLQSPNYTYTRTEHIPQYKKLIIILQIIINNIVERFHISNDALRLTEPKTENPKRENKLKGETVQEKNKRMTEKEAPKYQ